MNEHTNGLRLEASRRCTFHGMVVNVERAMSVFILLFELV